jgi:deazaflavin-dependent oxidoreductase (nitroreductase family)
MSGHPAWYLNLGADPRAVVQLGRAEIPVRARDATEEERNRLWPALTAIYEHFDAYQARTARQIPVVILSPA